MPGSDKQHVIGPQIRLSGGVYFDLSRYNVRDLTIEHVARSLSKTCRFAGHIDHFYSVAQHSLLMSVLVPPRAAVAALLHDAHESLIGDLPKPFKSAIPGWNRVEDTLQALVLRRFGLPQELPPEVKAYDILLGANEARCLWDDFDEDREHWELFDLEAELFRDYWGYPSVEGATKQVYLWAQETGDNLTCRIVEACTTRHPFLRRSFKRIEKLFIEAYESYVADPRGGSDAE